VLNEIAFWLFFVPVGTVDALMGMIETASAQGLDVKVNDLEALTAMEVIITIPLVIIMVYLVIWGQSCTLMVAKRLVSSPAGRNRTSFKAVRTQAKKYIGALFLTELLRGALTILWALLLIVPGVIYSIRTVFYDIMMIEEGKVGYGRPILNRSKEFVTGRTKDVLLKLLIMGVCIFIPIAILDGLLSFGITAIDERLSTLALVLSDLIEAFAGMFFLVCTVALYADLKKSSSSYSPRPTPK
ncbi:MAG: hypothetical protein QF442_03780, partial [Candidatus Peribacteraceae bacterium]|nr:hypothetical protein [Candidatus Peribacteraceae bacterium]